MPPEALMKQAFFTYKDVSDVLSATGFIRFPPARRGAPDHPYLPSYLKEMLRRAR